MDIRGFGFSFGLVDVRGEMETLGAVPSENVRHIRRVQLWSGTDEWIFVETVGDVQHAKLLRRERRVRVGDLERAVDGEFSDYFSQLFTVNGEGDGEDEESADEEEIQGESKGIGSRREEEDEKRVEKEAVVFRRCNSLFNDNIVLGMCVCVCVYLYKGDLNSVSILFSLNLNLKSLAIAIVD